MLLRHTGLITSSSKHNITEEYLIDNIYVGISSRKNTPQQYMTNETTLILKLSVFLISLPAFQLDLHTSGSDTPHYVQPFASLQGGTPKFWTRMVSVYAYIMKMGCVYQQWMSS